MTHVGAKRIEELFERALDLPPTERDAFLDRQCGADGELREKVERLLRLDGELPDEFLRAGRPSGATHLTIGDVLGGYEILGVLGEGGMGTVYEAQQASPRRRVALKVIRTRYASSTALRRFRREAEVLGSLHHPGIAQVYEAGTAEVEREDGARLEVPFLAMELVRGPSLREYAASGARDVRARLELVARLGDAVQHAHVRGIIHRDLKSENVLVAEHQSTADSSAPASDARIVGQPKVLDFGVARAVDPEERTLDTQFGQILGTLGTMSPEQVSGDGNQVDVRTDVYALGVILFELLAGRPPLDLTGCTVTEAARRIANEEPPSLGSLDPSLRGDVSVIAAKALHKDKERRYQSAADLAEDLRRHLAGRAIEARADSTLYVLGKSIRRHRVLSASIAVVLALTSSFAAVFSLQARRLEQELAISNIERGRLFGLDRSGLGEDLIWPEFLADPGSPYAYWALWEFYSSNPCVLAKRISDTGIESAEVAPDGSWLAIGDEQGAVRIWDPSGAGLRHTLQAASSEARTLVSSPDGRRLAAAHRGGELGVWDVEAGELVWASQDDGLGVAWRSNSLDFHPEGRLLAGAVDDTVRVWDSETGEVLRALEHVEDVGSVTFAPTGDRLLAAGSTMARLWHFPASEPALTWEHGMGPIAVATFDPRGERLYIGGGDKTLTAWELEPLRETHRLHPGNGWYFRLWTDPDGMRLYTTGLYRIDRFRLPEMTRDGSIPFFGIKTPGVAMFPRGERFAAADSSGVLRIWEWGGETGVLRFPVDARPASVDLSPQGDRIAIGDANGVVRIHHVETGELQLHLDGLASRVRSISFHPSGELLGAASEEGVLLVWDAATGRAVFRIDGVHDKSSRSFDFSPGGDRLAACGDDSTFRVWSLERPDEPLIEVHGLAESLSVAFSPDGELLAGVSRVNRDGRWDFQVDLWTQDGVHVRRIAPRDFDPWTLAFSSDGRKLASGTWQRNVAVWDVASGRLEALLDGHDGTVWNVRFLPGDPDTLVTSSADGTVRLWSVSMERNVCTLTASHRASVYGLDSSSDGTLLAASGEGADVLVWDLTHFERHIAGNLDLQLERHGASAPPRLRAWRDEVLARPWPRFDSWER